MTRIALRHTNPQRIGVSQQQQSIGFGFCPTLVIGGGSGNATTIEAWWDMPGALGLEVITAEDINQSVSSIWHDIFDLGIIPGSFVPAETIAVIPLKTNDAPLELLWDIPQELTITNIPSQDINQAIATLWQATFE